MGENVEVTVKTQKYGRKKEKKLLMAAILVHSGNKWWEVLVKISKNCEIVDKSQKNELREKLKKKFPHAGKIIAPFVKKTSI